MPDIFDRISIKDIFDRVELPDEEKVIFNPEMSKLVLAEIRKEIAKIPIGKIISQNMEQEQSKRKESDGSFREKISDELGKKAATLDGKLNSMESKLDDFIKKLRQKYDELKTEINQPRYEFGGFPLSGGGLPFANWRFRESGTDLVVETLVNGTWVESAGFQRPA